MKTSHIPSRRTAVLSAQLRQRDLRRAAALTAGELGRLLRQLPDDTPVEIEWDGRRRWAVDLVGIGGRARRRVALR